MKTAASPLSTTWTTARRSESRSCTTPGALPSNRPRHRPEPAFPPRAVRRCPLRSLPAPVIPSPARPERATAGALLPGRYVGAEVTRLVPRVAHRAAPGPTGHPVPCTRTGSGGPPRTRDPSPRSGTTPNRRNRPHMPPPVPQPDFRGIRQPSTGGAPVADGARRR